MRRHNVRRRPGLAVAVLLARALPAMLVVPVLALALFLSPAPPTGAQTQDAPEAEIERTTFLPQVFYVGDRVEMRVAFRTSPGAAPRLPEDSPSIPWGTLHRVGLAEDLDRLGASCLFYPLSARHSDPAADCPWRRVPAGNRRPRAIHPR